MAVKPVTSFEAPGTSYIDIWTLALNDTGAPVCRPGAADKSVAIGTSYPGTKVGATYTITASVFGTGGSVTLQGALAPADTDPTTIPSGDWFPLTDPQGNAITKTAAALETVEEGVLWIRPACTAGDGTTLINVALHSRGTMT